jgi:UDP-perosamine 4-acetyltransferase
LGAFALSDENSTASLPLIILGGGGHAKVLASTLLLLNRKVLGFVDVDATVSKLLGLPNLGDDDAVSAYPPEKVRLVNGVGSIRSTVRRRELYNRFVENRYVFETIIHPSAIVSPDVEIGMGAQIMAGAVVQTGSKLGVNSIINTGACVDHDCLIEAHVHIAPGVSLSGEVHAGEGCHIGTGATIIQGIKVGAASVVGAGAVVIRDVPERATVLGVPADLLTRRKLHQQ